MSTRCIYNIDLKTNNNEIISIPSDSFDHFYIANLNDEGDEINYGFSNDNTIVANFFMVRVLNNTTKEMKGIFNRLLEKNDIVGLTMYFTNGDRQEFSIPKKRVANNGILGNKYQETFLINNDIGIVITDKKLKYKKELFV